MSSACNFNDPIRLNTTTNTPILDDCTTAPQFQNVSLKFSPTQTEPEVSIRSPDLGLYMKDIDQSQDCLCLHHLASLFVVVYLFRPISFHYQNLPFPTPPPHKHNASGMPPLTTTRDYQEYRRYRPRPTCRSSKLMDLQTNLELNNPSNHTKSS